MPFKPLHCIYGNVIIPQRWVLAIILHFAVLNAYNQRVVIHVAINEMVKPMPKGNSSEVKDDCPNLIADPPPPQKDGQYAWDSNDQGLIKYIFFAGYFLGHLPGGWLADKIGARHVAGTCLLLSAIINLILPVGVVSGGEKWGFIICVIIRFILGLFQGSIIPSIATFMSAWAPRKERAMLGGVAYGGGNLGNIMGIAVTGVVIYYTHSWAMAFYLWGLLTIVWYVFFLFTAFSYPETHPFITEEEKQYLIENTAKKGEKFKVPWVQICKCCPVWAILAAQWGHNYVLFMMNTDLPKFVKDYLKMNIKNNGFVSALPFIFCWISAILSGFVADFITNRQLMSILNMRKLLTIISIIVPAFCNLGSVYIGCSRFWVIFFCTFGMFWMGPFWPALKVNVNDLSRRYGGVLMAIINGIGATAGVLAPFITGYFTKHVVYVTLHYMFKEIQGGPISWGTFINPYKIQFLVFLSHLLVVVLCRLVDQGSLRQWRIVFWIMMGIATVTSAIYLFFASADRQDWDYLEGEEHETNERT